MCTGWTYENKRSMFPVKRKGRLAIHLVPYSEHSSFTELQEYVRFLRPNQARLPATVALMGVWTSTGLAQQLILERSMRSARLCGRARHWSFQSPWVAFC